MEASAASAGLSAAPRELEQRGEKRPIDQRTLPQADLSSGQRRAQEKEPSAPAAASGAPEAPHFPLLDKDVEEAPGFYRLLDLRQPLV